MSTLEQKFSIMGMQVKHALRHLQLAAELFRGGQDEGDTQALPHVAEPREADAPVVRRRTPNKTEIATSALPVVDEDSQTRPVAASGPAYVAPPDGWEWSGEVQLGRVVIPGNHFSPDLRQDVRLEGGDRIIVEYASGGLLLSSMGRTIEVPLAVVRALLDRKRKLMEAHG